MHAQVERRRNRRMVLSAAVKLTHAMLGTITGVTRDVSMSGAFLYVDPDSWKQGGSIEYVLLPAEEPKIAHSSPVLCFGTIVRVEPSLDKVGLAVVVDSCVVLPESR